MWDEVFGLVYRARVQIGRAQVKLHDLVKGLPSHQFHRRWQLLEVFPERLALVTRDEVGR
jgi:hypothetical protein